MNNPHLLNGNLMNVKTGELLNQMENLFLFYHKYRRGVWTSDMNLGSPKVLLWGVFSGRINHELSVCETHCPGDIYE